MDPLQVDNFGWELTIYLGLLELHLVVFVQLQKMYNKNWNESKKQFLKNVTLNGTLNIFRYFYYGTEISFVDDFGVAFTN